MVKKNRLRNLRSRIPLKHIPKNAICAEIGVWRGSFSGDILKSNPKELHLIDPWVYQDYDRWYGIPQEEMDVIHEDVVKLFGPNEAVTIHRKMSIETTFADNYFDWVYIDGNHDYEAVLADLRHYAPLIKQGGVLCGDDYGWTDKYANGGPKRAVDEFILETGYVADIDPKSNQFAIKGLF